MDQSLHTATSLHPKCIICNVKNHGKSKEHEGKSSSTRTSKINLNLKKGFSDILVIQALHYNKGSTTRRLSSPQES